MFKDRRQAGNMLAKALSKYKGKKGVIVLGIPRGGVIVAAQVAKALRAGLDVIIVKKIGFPGNEEFAMGAAGIDDYILNEETALHVDKSYVVKKVRSLQNEIKRRYEEYRGKKAMHSLKDKTVIIVDDGIATGSTVKMALKLLRKEKPDKLIVATPVAPPETVKELEKAADEVVVLQQPLLFYAIGQFYQDFGQTEDEEVIASLGAAKESKPDKRQDCTR